MINDREKLKKIIHHYGAYPQISKAVEELIEQLTELEEMLNE